jgi:hypothetical protein
MAPADLPVVAKPTQARRYFNRALLVLSIFWICYALGRMMIEPTFGRFFAIQPLRAVLALGSLLFLPPVILFAAGSVAWFVGTRLWHRVRPPQAEVSVRVTSWYRQPNRREGDIP